MLKILILVERFYPEDFLVNDLASEWKRMGHEVEVLTQVPSYPFDKIFDGYENKTYQTTMELDDIPVHRVSTIFGYNTSVEVKLPKNWDELLLDAEIDMGPAPVTV